MVTRETTTTMQDPYNASYGVEDPEFAITQLAQTTMRSELGKISLGEPFFSHTYCAVFRLHKVTHNTFYTYTKQ